MKYNIGEELSIEMTEMLEYMLPIYCASNIFWEYLFSDYLSAPALTGLVIGIVNAMLPMEYINRLLFPSKEKLNIVKPLREVEDSFLTVYFN